MTKVFVMLIACSLSMLPGCETGKPDEESVRPLQRHGTTLKDSSAALPMSVREVLRDSLRSRGMYDCCTKPECLECAEKQAGCTCYNDIALKDPICGECLAGYKRGEGRLKFVSIPELEKIREGKKR